jgi:prophage regulatory protein
METTTPTPTKIISQKELATRVPYSTVQIWRLEKAGNFPRRIKLGPNRVGWVEDEVEAWLRQRMEDRDAA